MSIMVMLSAGYLTRPFCLLEVITAIKMDVPLIVVNALGTSVTFDFEKLKKDRANPKYVKSLLNAEGWGILDRAGYTERDVAKAVETLANFKGDQYNPNNPESVLEAEIEQIFKHMEDKLPGWTLKLKARRDARKKVEAPTKSGVAKASSVQQELKTENGWKTVKGNIDFVAESKLPLLLLDENSDAEAIYQTEVEVRKRQGEVLAFAKQKNIPYPPIMIVFDDPRLKVQKAIWIRARNADYPTLMMVKTRPDVSCIVGFDGASVSPFIKSLRSVEGAEGFASEATEYYSKSRLKIVKAMKEAEREWEALIEEIDDDDDQDNIFSDFNPSSFVCNCAACSTSAAGPSDPFAKSQVSPFGQLTNSRGQAPTSGLRTAARESETPQLLASSRRRGSSFSRKETDSFFNAAEPWQLGFPFGSTGAPSAGMTYRLAPPASVAAAKEKVLDIHPHGLKPLKVGSEATGGTGRRFCDFCRIIMQIGETCYNCRPCNFDLCPRCVEAVEMVEADLAYGY